MSFSAQVEPLSGTLPRITFTWDPETEILSGHFSGADRSTGLTGSVELEGADGSFAVLDVAAGIVRGLEVVVWPPITVVADLKAPTPKSRGRLSLPSRVSQPGIAAVELETSLVAEKSGDQSVIHLKLGPRRKVTIVQLADNLLLDVDGEDEIAGFWLLGVPPFPQREVPEA